jgi:8-oxo-dGTP pyrophosphatase MutT (NUDIX family)
VSIIDKIAWLRFDGSGRILSTRSHGKSAYYLPGGKREPGETDEQTLLREIHEELTVELLPATLSPAGTFEAQAHGHATGVRVRMTCYFAEYRGTIRPAAEIAEVVWLTYRNRHQVSPVDQLIFDSLYGDGFLAD